VDRATVEFETGGHMLTLPVLTHEFGHVWGLCDQYEGPTNCDPEHSTSHKVLDSTMGAAGAREKIFLTDDDIDGIRALAARHGFNDNWPNTTAALKAAPKPTQLKEIELFRIESAAPQDSKLLVRYGLVTNRGGEYHFEVRERGTAKWTPL